MFLDIYLLASMGIADSLKNLTRKNEDESMTDSGISSSIKESKGSGKSATDLVELIFLEAVSGGASDIHIEPHEDILKVRLRIDGHFSRNLEYPLGEHASVIARIKILANLKIDEQRLPQDGKAVYREEKTGKDIDLRVSVMPTIYGEKIVIRILKKGSEMLDLRSIGMLPMNVVKVKKQLDSNFGLILVVGPTGSGKSTTLYSMLSLFDPAEKNISTLEDPVEYRINGVNHTQIHPQIGFSFADGLRSLLRQDPDILMVGEIRDSETAHLAVEASITGHLVFSTIHANSTVNTLQRLSNLGIDPLLIVSSLKMIISQRLARKLCPHCKIAYSPEESLKNKILARIGKYVTDTENFTLYKAHPEGCPKCSGKGYK